MEVLLCFYILWCYILKKVFFYDSKFYEFYYTCIELALDNMKYIHIYCIFILLNIFFLEFFDTLIIYINIKFNTLQKLLKAKLNKQASKINY